LELLETSAAAALTPITGPQSLVSQVEARLREAILAGELPSGSHLSVPELARRLGVSRTPVREAVAALERAGLAELRPRYGAVVLGGGRHDLTELFELREALDGMAARLAASRMSPGERRQLQDIMRRHTQAVRRGQVEQHVEYDTAFHQLVRDGAHNAKLTADLDRLRDQILLVLRSVSSQPGAMGRGVLHDHNAILDAILNAAPDDAERAARQHVRAVLRFVLDTTFEATVRSAPARMGSMSTSSPPG
jgi:DNA-binding GntR family transcriptional regulator